MSFYIFEIILMQIRNIPSKKVKDITDKMRDVLSLKEMVILKQYIMRH
jgi:hypothetical protein